MSETKESKGILRVFPDYEEENPISISLLSPEQLEDVKTSFEAARSFEDDDQYLPIEVHQNTPTPGMVLPVKRPPPPKKMPPPPTGPAKKTSGWKRSQVPKGPWLKKSPTMPTAKVTRPSQLRHTQTQEYEEDNERPMRARADTIRDSGDDYVRTGGAASSMSSTFAKVPSTFSFHQQREHEIAETAENVVRAMGRLSQSGSIDQTQGSINNPDNDWTHASNHSLESNYTHSSAHAYAVQYPQNEPLVGEEGEDGVMHGHWDRRCV